MKDSPLHRIFRSQRILFLFILCAGVFIRFYQLGHYDLWYDEAYSVIRSTNIVRYLSRIDTHMQAPLYYVFLHIIIRLFGNSEIAIRIPSALASILAIILLYRILKARCSPHTALVGALLCALSPFQLWYAQEARVYSLAFCMSLVLIWLFLTWYKKEGRGTREIVLLSLASIIALMIHYFLIFIIVPILICFVFGLEKEKRAFFLYIIPVVLIAAFPIYPIFLRQIVAVKEYFWLTPPTISDLVFTLSNVIFGYTIPAYMSMCGFFLILILVAYWLIRAEKNIIYILCVCCGICPIIILFFLSQYIPVFLPRPLIVFSPFILMIVSHAIILIRTPFLKIILAIILLTICMRGITDYYRMHMPIEVQYHRGVLPKKQFKPIVKELQDTIKTSHNTVLIHTINNVFSPFLYYLNTIDQIFLTIDTLQTDAYAKKVHYRDTTDLMYSVDSKKVAYMFKEIYLTDLSQINELPSLLSQYDSLWLVRAGWHRDGSTSAYSDSILKAVGKAWYWAKKDSIYYDGIYLDHFKRRQNK